MSDLDDEKLEATRKLNVVDKESIIEKDISILKRFNPGDERTEEIKRAIDHVLAEREADKQKIKELEEENLRLKGRIDVTNWQEKTVYESLKEKYIPVQKVKEILDKAEVMDYYTLPNVIEDLEKLLEDK